MRPLLSALILSCCMWPPLQAQSTPPPAESQPAPQSAVPSSSGTEPTIADQQKAPEPQLKAAEGNSVVKDQPAAGAAVATLGADGKRIEPPPCARKDKECARKRKSLLHRKDIGMKVANGTLTVDGWTGKAHLNYDIHDVKFLYVSIPGTGTVIASMEQFPNSIEQKNALDGKTLTLKTPDDHIVQLSSDEALIDKKEHVFYVLLDKTYVQPGRFPTMGYGTTAQAPYAWPSARPTNAGEQKLSASAPPLPPWPAGQAGAAAVSTGRSRAEANTRKRQRCHPDAGSLQNTYSCRTTSRHTTGSDTSHVRGQWRSHSRLAPIRKGAEVGALLPLLQLQLCGASNLTQTRSLATETTKVEQLCAADFIGANLLHLVHNLAVVRKDALNALAEAHLADGEAALRSVLASNAHALKRLQTLFIAFLDLYLNANSVAGCECGQIGTLELCRELLHDGVNRHDGVFLA